MTAYEMRISDWSSDVCSSDLHRAELLVEIGDTELDTLRLPHQLVDLADRLLERLQFGEADGGQVLRLIDEARCLVLEHPDLIVDLLQRPRGGQIGRAHV